MFKKYQALQIKHIDKPVYYITEYLKDGSTIIICQFENYGPLIHCYPIEINWIIDDEDCKFIN